MGHLVVHSEASIFRRVNTKLNSRLDLAVIHSYDMRGLIYSVQSARPLNSIGNFNLHQACYVRLAQSSQAYCWTSSCDGGTGSCVLARLHYVADSDVACERLYSLTCQNARTSSGLKDPTTVCSTCRCNNEPGLDYTCR